MVTRDARDVVAFGVANVFERRALMYRRPMRRGWQ